MEPTPARRMIVAGSERRSPVRNEAKRASRRVGLVAKFVERSAHDLAMSADQLAQRVFIHMETDSAAVSGIT
jgi:hypothetical protein